MELLTKITNELFDRGLEVQLKPIGNGEYEIYPYPIYMHLELLDDPEVLDWIAHTAKEHTQIHNDTIDGASYGW